MWSGESGSKTLVILTSSSDRTTSTILMNSNPVLIVKPSDPTPKSVIDNAAMATKFSDPAPESEMVVLTTIEAMESLPTPESDSCTSAAWITDMTSDPDPESDKDILTEMSTDSDPVAESSTGELTVMLVMLSDPTPESRIAFRVDVITSMLSDPDPERVAGLHGLVRFIGGRLQCSLRGGCG